MSNADAGTDSYDIPYLLEQGGPYVVLGHKQYGKPRLLQLRDYNGDNKPYEIALFEAESCSDMYNTIIGYSPRRDRLVNYVFRLRNVTPGQDTTVQDSLWIESFASQRPIAKGHWRWTVVHPPGVAEDYDVLYNPKQELFHGTVSSREWQPAKASTPAPNEREITLEGGASP